MENRKLAEARAKKHWTIAKVCELTGISEKTYRRCERGTHKPHYYTIDTLCHAFNMTAEELGFLQETNTLPANSTDVVTIPRDQINTIIYMLQLGENEMTHFDPTRRKAIIQALLAASSASAVPQALANLEPWERLSRAIVQPLNVNNDTLAYFQQLINTCWGLSNNSQDATVERILPSFLPHLETIAQQPANNQQQVCALVAEGYVLASEVDRNDITRVEHYCNLASQYSEISENYNIQVAALKQQATVASVAGKKDKALEIYLRALALAPFVSTLLKARVYMGLASIYARNNTTHDLATKYLDLASETFPQEPEKDSSYLYTTTSGTAILNLYGGLTHINLGKYQEAWDTLEQVNGIGPKIYIAESTRIEFINLQAEAAVGLGDSKISCEYLEASIKASRAAGYNLRTSESFEIYQQIKQKWPNENSVKELIELFH